VSPRDGVSDINYAIQISNPPLLANGNIVARHVDAVPNNPDTGYTSYTSFLAYENSFARTAVGSGPNGVLFMVVADGEGVQGGAGATPNQLGHFFHDVLAASAAMAIDSGLSTELVLKGATGQRHVNTITGEDATIQTNPYTETLKHRPGGIGAVANYSMVNPR
jgi:hypothetical protein